MNKKITSTTIPSKTTRSISKPLPAQLPMHSKSLILPTSTRSLTIPNNKNNIQNSNERNNDRNALSFNDSLNNYNNFNIINNLPLKDNSKSGNSWNYVAFVNNKQINRILKNRIGREKRERIIMLNKIRGFKSFSRHAQANKRKRSSSGHFIPDATEKQPVLTVVPKEKAKRGRPSINKDAKIPDTITKESSLPEFNEAEQKVLFSKFKVMTLPDSFDPKSFISLINEKFPDSTCQSVNDIKFFTQDQRAKGFFYTSNLAPISSEEINDVNNKFGIKNKRPRGRPTSKIIIPNLTDSENEIENPTLSLKQHVAPKILPKRTIDLKKSNSVEVASQADNQVINSKETSSETSSAHGDLPLSIRYQMGKLFNVPNQVRNDGQSNTGLDGLDLLGSIVSNLDNKSFENPEISHLPNLTTVPTLVSRNSTAPSWPINWGDSFSRNTSMLRGNSVTRNASHAINNLFSRASDNFPPSTNFQQYNLENIISAPPSTSRLESSFNISAPLLSTSKSSLEALLIQSGNETSDHHSLKSIVEKHRSHNGEKRKVDQNSFKVPKKSKHN